MGAHEIGRGFFPLPGKFGGLAIVYLSNLIFSRRASFIIALASVLGFAVLAMPSKSRAQNEATPQDSGQGPVNPASPSQPKPVVELPEGDGKAIATEFCQDCHKLTNVTKAKKDPDDWHDTVQLMLDRGARLPQGKVDTLVAYLAKNFGPKAEAPISGTGSPDASPAASSPSNH